MTLRYLANPGFAPIRVPAVDTRARAFHEQLEDYQPTPLRPLKALAAELGVAELAVKDETNRLGLPAFKILGASWAIERALSDSDDDVQTLVAASAGNHGRAVAHVARDRGLGCRIFVSGRSVQARRDAIEAEGAEVVVIDGSYEDAVEAAEGAALERGSLEISDVGDSRPARDVIDGYATLFSELSEQGAADVIVVPIGVGSLGAAAARHCARVGATAVGVEPRAAGCLTASLLAGRPTEIATPGTAMAGMDCAAVSEAAWPSLGPGIAGTVLVEDEELDWATNRLAEEAGIDAGECSAGVLAAVRTLADDPRAAPLRRAIGMDSDSRVVAIASEGPTGRAIATG